MIQNKLLHFETRAAFEAAKRYPGIADTSIAFVKEGRTIYTHGVEYNAGASVDIDSTIQLYLENLYQDIFDGVYTKEQVDAFLNTKQPMLISGTNIKTINGQSLLGSGNINIEGGEDAEGEAGGHWENIYKATLTDATPTLPTNFDNNPEGWAHYAENSDGSKVIWMATRFVDGAGNANAWQGPWRISGANGEAGVDGDSTEYIYARTTVEDSSILSNPNASYNNNSAFQVDDYVPAGWNDNPAGIDSTNKYEWMCFRVKHHSESDRNGTWSSFVGPILWSAYGRQGMDGDGVEYIFYVTTDGSSIPTGANMHPEMWTGDPGFQNNEYIRSGSGWVDEPVDLSTYGQGAKQWVSMRKRQNEVWGSYSEPALWSYISKDGVVNGYNVHLTNQNMLMGTNEDGTVVNFSGTCTVQVFHNGDPDYTFTINIGNITRSDNGNTSGISATVSGAVVTVTANNVPSFELVNASVPVTVNLSDGTSRTLTINLFGVASGTDGKDAVDMYVTAAAIKVDADKLTVTPSTIQVGVKVGSVKYPANRASGFRFKYRYNYTGEYTTLSNTSTITPSISIGSSDIVALNIVMEKQDPNTGTYSEYDTQDIPYVYEQTGIPGTAAVNYGINVISNSIVLNPNNNTCLGAVTFQLTKTVGSEIINLNESSTEFTNNDINLKVRVLGGETTPTKDSTYTYRVTIPSHTVYNGTNPAFTLIQILSSTNTVLASSVVPFNIKGENGGVVQSLTGSVMRFWNQYESTRTYYNGDLADPEDGVKYMDIVRDTTGDNGYYRLGLTRQTNVDSNNVHHNLSDSSYWIRFQALPDSYINNLIATNIAATNITAKQIVITRKNSSNVDIPVAGMVNGSYVPKDGNNNTVGTNDNGVRIFAGTIPSNGDLADTAFNVDEDGKMEAAGGNVVFNSDGSGNVAGGNIAWNADGEITLQKVDPINVDHILPSGVHSMKNAIIITNVCFDANPSLTMPVRPNDSATSCILNVDGFLVKNGIIVGQFSEVLNDVVPVFIFDNDNNTATYGHKLIQKLFLASMNGGELAQTGGISGQMLNWFRATDMIYVTMYKNDWAQCRFTYTNDSPSYTCTMYASCGFVYSSYVTIFDCVPTTVKPGLVTDLLTRYHNNRNNPDYTIPTNELAQLKQQYEYVSTDVISDRAADEQIYIAP